MAPQDSFIDEEDDTCPLCVEEFDLSDKNFRPCPCGYQVCQFCFNNIKNNMNGLCPACRRPYDEKTIEWKVVTPEEIAQFKANIQKNAKKKAEQRQKEAQKREVESLNRKHLSGLRVIQKNLVYVMGLSPTIKDEEILQTLRGEKYFGQYGKIIKIVVSKAKQSDGQNPQSLGVYVTFARKEDAARCIAAVNGSQNGDRILRAQLGTTKYCSAYLRNETCTNKQCMFLHEPGDNDDSYSRQDLSSINSVSTQRPLPSTASSAPSSSRQISQVHIQQGQSATHAMAREGSKDGSDSGDGSALPSSASWANRGIQQRSRRGSHATSGAASSPAISHVTAAVPETSEIAPQTVQEPQESVEQTNAIQSEEAVVDSPKPQKNETLLELLKSIHSPLITFSSKGGESDAELLSAFPPLFDCNGGEKRRVMREQQEEARLHIEQETQAEHRSATEPGEEEEPGSGSLQLGGEPEDNGRESNQTQSFQRRPSSQLPIQKGGAFGSAIGQNYAPNIGNLSSINGRTLTPQQQQQLLLLKSGQPQSGFVDQFTPGVGLSQSSLFQQQGHNRQSSRYSFANDGAAGSASVKPSANPKLMAQQSSMMPPLGHSQQGNQFYGSSMPGPPPGLKSSGTPPISGGMFGQGQSFAGSLGSSMFSASQKDSNSDILRDMLRGRGGVTPGGSQVHDTGKLDDQNLPSLDEATHSVDALVADTAPFYGVPRSVDWFGIASRSSTPSVPPGLPIPHAHMSPLAPGNVLSNALPRPTPPPGIPTQRQFNVGPALQAATPAPGASIALTANQQSQTSKVTETSGTHTKENVKPLTPNTGLSKAPASSSLGSHTSSSIQPEDFPALERTGEKFEQISVPSKQPIPTPIAKLDNKTGSQAPGMDAPNKTPSKRSTPGILNITVPTATQPPSTPETNHKSTLAPSAFPPLPPSAPPIPTQSPAPKAAPKMLRVIPTPKADVPAGSIATPSSATSTVPINFPPSRQPSLASASRLERPATPASENVSDNASITSASLSRASSPPPSKVGSAPVRTTTKSMQKKQRREAQKEKEKSAVEATILKPEPEVEIAPIVGRKKKQKKEKISNNTAGGSTPVVSRPASPGAGAVAVATKTEVITREPLPLAPEKPLSPSKDINKAKVNDAKGKSKSKSKNIAPVETTATITEQPEEAPEKQITPSWALQQLVSSGFIKDPTSLGLLQPPVGVNHRHEFSGEASNVDQKLTITQEDESALLSGKPVHKIVEGSRILLTPSGNCVRNLTPEEEERYLELQSQLSKEPPVVTFNSGKEHANKGFTLIGGRAVPSGSTAFLPSSSGPSSQFDPVTKIHHDEALNYINQYVLPSLATPLQLEKALNTTGPNPEANQPESTIWARWMNDASATGSERSESASGMANRADILAAGWASMAAQFAIGHENEKNDTLGNVSLLSVDEAESAIQLARKETEVLEKKLNVLIKKNRRLLLGSGH